MLLNVGPKADGSIPDEAADRLLGLGEWLHINGEAIYNTRHWYTFGEGSTKVAEGHMREHEDKPFTAEDIRFTVRGNNLYATCLGWPSEKAHIKTLRRGSSISEDQISNIEMLGSSESLSWIQDAEGLWIDTPSEQPCDHAFVFKLTLKG